MFAVFSGKIARIPFLDIFLKKNVRLCSRMTNIRNFHGVVGWGAKPTTLIPREKANKYRLPFIALEDGFIHSFGLNQHMARLSLIVDKKGIYYDSTTISELEELLNSEQNILYGRQDEVIKARRLICELQISKYNLPHQPELSLPTGKKVLVVDQTYGDMSVKLGGASVQTFTNMLKAARKEHPDALICIKTHPEVSNGNKTGYLTHIQPDEKTLLIHECCNPIALLKQVDHVYVVTSTMGFEALLVNKPVSVFGIPWYSGWGATDDRQTIPRRKKSRSVNELFAAGYFDYTRYLNPETKQLGSIFNAIDWIKRQQDQARRFPGRMICVGFRYWKRANLNPILSLASTQVIFVNDAKQAEELSLIPGDNLVFWGCTPPPGLEKLSLKYSAKLIRLEDGFVRSVGLGSDLVKPMSIVMDDVGLYFDANQPSTLEKILNEGCFSEQDHQRAAWIKKFIIRHGITKYNTEPLKPPKWQHEGKRVLLVIGQVEDDSSIRTGALEIKTNLALLQVVRKRNPDAWIVFKPHPDVLSGNRKGVIDITDTLRFANHLEINSSVISCIEHADEVHTITSLSGFDALLRGKKVFAYGRPFYAGWGLLENDIYLPNRTRKLTIDELIIGVLIKYPIYWDWQLNCYTSCEGALINIYKQLALRKSTKVNYLQRQIRKLSILVKAVISGSPYFDKKSLSIKN